MKKFLIMFLLLNCIFLNSQEINFTAYNDCVYLDSNQYIGTNVTTYGIGYDFTGESSGYLINHETGEQLGIKAIINENGGVTWSPLDYGGTDCAENTDAYNTFHGITDMTGVISYGEQGWWVDITFTGLDPDKIYTFATSSSRDNYTDRYTIYTIKGADSYINSSSTGADILSEDKTKFNTGGNHDEGYIAKWTEIRALDGTFTVRAESDPSSPEGIKAYAFDVFMLQEIEGNKAPYNPTLIFPDNGSIQTNTSVNLSATVSDIDGDSLDVTFYGREVPENLENFSIIVLPDTQMYSKYFPAVFTSQVQWIKDNIDTKNIIFVTHEGDLVQDYDDEAQWQTAENCMNILNDVVKYGVLPGNHDQPTDLYNIYFPYTDFNTYSWYGGNYPTGQNDNNYQLFSAGGVDFIIMHLGFYPNDDVIQWADSIIKAHPNRKAIITTHGYLGWTGERTDVHGMNSSEYIWLDLVENNPNVHFVLCGHVHVEKRISDYANGHLVHQILADYQDEENGGNGWLRIMEFSPKDNKVYVKTYSPFLDQYRTGSDSEFELDFVMNDFTPIQTINDVQSGSSVSATWTNLTPGAEYEWYVSVNDGELNKESLKSKFEIISPEWTAFNDCIYSSENQYIHQNATTFGIGTEYKGATSGNLKNIETGEDTGVTVLLTQNGAVNWQPGLWMPNAGSDCAAGTDAYNTFGGTVDMTGVVWYGDEGWWVDLTFIGLDPNKKYNFTASSSRDNYTDRYTIYTLKGADNYINSSTDGVIVMSNDKVKFNTGGNHTEGYVVRWTGITAADGTFTVRAEAAPESPESRLAYAFDVFKLEEVNE